MATFTFDTHKLVRELIDVGFEERQAETFMKVFKESQDFADAAAQRYTSDLRREINDLRKDINAKLAEIKFDLLKWIIGLGIAQTGLLVTLKLFAS